MTTVHLQSAVAPLFSDYSGYPGSYNKVRPNVHPNVHSPVQAALFWPVDSNVYQLVNARVIRQEFSK